MFRSIGRRILLSLIVGLRRSADLLSHWIDANHRGASTHPAEQPTDERRESDGAMFESPASEGPSAPPVHWLAYIQSKAPHLFQHGLRSGRVVRQRHSLAVQAPPLAPAPANTMSVQRPSAARQEPDDWADPHPAGAASGGTATLPVNPGREDSVGAMADLPLDDPQICSQLHSPWDELDWAIQWGNLTEQDSVVGNMWRQLAPSVSYASGDNLKGSLVSPEPLRAERQADADTPPARFSEGTQSGDSGDTPKLQSLPGASAHAGDLAQPDYWDAAAELADDLELQRRGASPPQPQRHAPPRHDPSSLLSDWVQFPAADRSPPAETPLSGPPHGLSPQRFIASGVQAFDRGYTDSPSSAVRASDDADVDRWPQLPAESETHWYGELLAAHRETARRNRLDREQEG